MIKNADFTSVWDDGVKITTPCKVDTETKEVFDIVVSETKGLDILEQEYITMDNIDCPVCNIEDNPTETDFWYE